MCSEARLVSPRIVLASGFERVGRLHDRESMIFPRILITLEPRRSLFRMFKGRMRAPVHFFVLALVLTTGLCVCAQNPAAANPRVQLTLDASEAEQALVDSAKKTGTPDSDELCRAHASRHIELRKEE